ncbi:hypothetical protein [Verrucosispora sp. WMMD573]|uniref:hypothetical protein n=1 Tax=Verrucosispora sp. WMMD573 TaxID=3015149 RepID=UPI00248CCF79|nr:hypothetical protein [Verrucosispora sp. WMMD573]WBB53611.1 hypothetical protein O7601_24080 [Verrucosispora sp. WMMD573]
MSDHSATVTDAVDVPGPLRLTHWFDERLTRVGVTGRFARDCLLAALLTVLTFLVMTLLFRFVAPTQGLTLGPARVPDRSPRPSDIWPPAPWPTPVSSSSAAT